MIGIGKVTGSFTTWIGVISSLDPTLVYNETSEESFTYYSVHGSPTTFHIFLDATDDGLPTGVPDIVAAIVTLHLICVNTIQLHSCAMAVCHPSCDPAYSCASLAPPQASRKLDVPKHC